MGWAKLVLVLVALQSISTLLPHRASAEDPLSLSLSPLFAPAFNNVCNRTYCGRGTCEESPEHALGYVCNCNPGWSQSHDEDHTKFLPCVVPKCTINYSCHADSTVPTESPLQHPTNINLLDPCLYSYCGGGTCVKTSDYKHRCECKEGFSNLMDDSSLPCYSRCSLEGDCASRGIGVSSDGGSSSGGDASNALLWMVMSLIPLAIARMR